MMQNTDVCVDMDAPSSSSTAMSSTTARKPGTNKEKMAQLLSNVEEKKKNDAVRRRNGGLNPLKAAAASRKGKGSFKSTDFLDFDKDYANTYFNIGAVFLISVSLILLYVMWFTDLLR